MRTADVYPAGAAPPPGPGCVPDDGNHGPFCRNDFLFPNGRWRLSRRPGSVPATSALWLRSANGAAKRPRVYPVANPRYTGRQVRNRQRTDHDLIDPANTGLGHRRVQRWDLPEGRVISARQAHPALVSEADFIAAQDATAGRGLAGPTARRYLLAGLSCSPHPAVMITALCLWFVLLLITWWPHGCGCPGPRCGRHASPGVEVPVGPEPFALVRRHLGTSGPGDIAVRRRG